MKKLLIPLVATALFIVAVGLLIRKTSTIVPSTSPQPTQTGSTVTINKKLINVKVVKTSEERAKGLSGVSSLDTNSGMLFVFQDTDKTPTFWMKEMLIPLDIIWIKDGKIIRIDKNVPIPAPKTPDNKLKIYSAGVKVNYVLEVNSGFSDSNSIKVGDEVIVSGI